jgi:NTP pyrophosphatase (non-canonical NTP hydrolase)
MREARVPGTKTMNQLAVEIEAWADRKGWNKDLVLSAQVANLHTEISEAWEEIRNNHAINEVYYNPEKPEKPEGFGVELADLIVRTLHICGHYGIDIDALVELKMAYNEKRPYRHGGKSA